MSTAAWSDIHPSQLVGPPACIQEYDLSTVTIAELEAPLKARCPSVCSFHHPNVAVQMRGRHCHVPAAGRTPCVLTTFHTFSHSLHPICTSLPTVFCGP